MAIVANRIAIVLAAGTLALAASATTLAAAAPASNASANAASPPADNVIYKWKDAHGVSQYSQQPPPKGVKFEMVPMAAPPPANSQPPPAAHPASSPTHSGV